MFRVNHPDATLQKFFNMVYQEKIDGSALIKLFEYNMTPEFAQKYYSGEKKMKDFEGSYSYKFVANNHALSSTGDSGDGDGGGTGGGGNTGTGDGNTGTPTGNTGAPGNNNGSNNNSGGVAGCLLVIHAHKEVVQLVVEELVARADPAQVVQEEELKALEVHHRVLLWLAQ